jgi:hypothetical protein
MKSNPPIKLAFGILCLALSTAAHAGSITVDLTLDGNFSAPDYAFYNYTDTAGVESSSIPVGPYISYLNGSGYNNLLVYSVCYDLNNPTDVGTTYSGTIETLTDTATLEATFLVNQLDTLGGISAPLAVRGALSLAIWEIMNPSSNNPSAVFPTDPAAQPYETEAATAVSNGSWTTADSALYPMWVPDDPSVQRFALVYPNDSPAPEPGSFAVMGLGLLGLVLWGRRRNRRG